MTEPAIRIEGMSKTFKTWRRSFVAVSDLNLSVDEGKVVAFVGPNGAGKTTTIYTLLGLLFPDQGTVRVFGQPAGSHAARQHIGYLSEIFYTYPYRSARAAMQLYGQLSGMSSAVLAKRIPEVLQRVGLSEAIDRKIGTFSKGMTQRLGLAQAMVHQPRLLILDEPTTGLDPEGRRMVVELIEQEKSRGATIFLSSHILSDVERTCDHVMMIRRGRIVAAAPLSDFVAGQDQWIVEVTRWQDRFAAQLSAAGYPPAAIADDIATVHCRGDQKEQLLRLVLDLGLGIGTVRQSRRSLEDLYLEVMNDEPSAPGLIHKEALDA